LRYVLRISSAVAVGDTPRASYRLSPPPAAAPGRVDAMPAEGGAAAEALTDARVELMK
jgi:hypothetical protein